jgi:putative redox protein
VEATFSSGGLRLTCHLARPVGTARGQVPGLVLCHGFPGGPQGAAGAGQSYGQLADRLASDAGWVVFTFCFRGAGGSEGNFSLGGWLADLHAAIAHLRGIEDVGGVWLAGSSTGGALALCAAAADPQVRGVATLAAPASFDDWAADPRGFLEHCRRLGVVRDPAFPPDPTAWAREIREVRPLIAAPALAGRPVLIVHGDRDDTVPLADARALADAVGPTAELRIVAGAGHRLRHDPRVVALLLGWLERQDR